MIFKMNSENKSFKKRTKWTKVKVELLKKYKEKDLSIKEIATLMNLTESSVKGACTVYRVLLNKKIREERRREAGLKGVKNKIKKYNLVEFTSSLVGKIKKLKEIGLENVKIAKKLGLPFNSVVNICSKHKIRLGEKIRKQRMKEAGLKGREIFRKKRKNLARLHSFDWNLGYILGVCFGDGSVIDRGNKGCIELRTTNKSFAKKFYNILLVYTKQKPCYYIRIYNKSFKKDKRNYFNVKFYEVFLNNIFFVRNILKNFGETKKWNIDVDSFLSRGKPFCFGFIKGLFDSEGSFWIDRQGLRGNVSFSSTNKEGTLNFHKLLIKLNFDFNLNSYKRENNKMEYKIINNKLSVVKRFYEEIGFNVDYKQERLEEFIALRNF